MTLRQFMRTASMASVVAASALPAQGNSSCFSELSGMWEGRGRVAGRDILMRQEWAPSLQGAFFELSMLHISTADSSTVMFSGRGFYRAKGDSIVGTWLDARGLTFQLSGACRNRALHMIWSGDVERGDTEYAVQADGTLLVIDRVNQGTNLREFGRTTLHRAAPRTPMLLAPGIVSTDLPEFATSISADGNELWFNRTNPDRSQITLFHTRRASGGGWEAPQIADFQGEFNAVDPFLTYDGRRLYFSSDRPRPGRAIRSFSTWYVERNATGWSAPIDPGEPMNSDSAEVFVSADRSGTVVFRSTRHGPAQFYATRLVEGRWTEPELIPISPVPGIGNPALSPTGRYLVFTRVVPGRGPDLYVSCRTASGFDAGRPLSDLVNSPYADFAPAFSPDERVLYFTSERPGIVGARPAGERPPSDIYEIGWHIIKPTCAVD